MSKKIIIVGTIIILLVGLYFITNSSSSNRSGTDNNLNVNSEQAIDNQRNDAVIKADMQLLKSALAQYYTQNQEYPADLAMLVDVYLHEVPQNPNIDSSYEYTSDGQTYTLSTTMSDGTPVSVSP